MNATSPSVAGPLEGRLRSPHRRTAASSAGYLLAELRPGQRLLDVGSGPGTITADLAEIVGPETVTALEISDEAVALTRQELTRRGLGQVRTVIGDVHALDLGDDSFDVVHAHMVMQHVADPVLALRQMARVTAPGGVVAVRDLDYGMFTWTPAHPALSEWSELYHELAWASGGEPDAGRFLPQWARAAGLDRLTVTSTTWCYADPVSVRWWADMWARRVLASDLAVRARAAGRTDADLDRIAAGWSEWGRHPDAMFLAPAVEVLARC